MEAFLQLLVAFETNASVHHNETEYIRNREIEESACELLVDSNGHCHWSNISIVKSAGFNVIPIERDRFGWVIGGIVTKKGIITYG